VGIRHKLSYMTQGPKERFTRRERTLVILAWIWLLAELPFVTNVSLDLCLTFPLLFFFGFMLELFWLAMTAAKPARRVSPKGKWWLSVPCVGLLALTFAITNWGLAIRVMLCETELQAAVDEVKGNQPGFDATPRRVGLFPVRTTLWANGEVRFCTNNELNFAGIAYVRPGTEGLPSRRTPTHLYGPWYRWWEKF
jgi:hypothetical protein